MERERWKEKERQREHQPPFLALIITDGARAVRIMRNSFRLGYFSASAGAISPIHTPNASRSAML